ncbi:uncharacterized protein LOC142558338 [Dermacentor variabilis]|uniref:uncharacterized protein LOC142558338 n=1 Tax=Dermacentor variabilis TaxID=34621 RepID=UPI003F5C288F
MWHINYAEPHPPFTVTVDVCGKPLCMEVDTGASVSVIAKSRLLQLLPSVNVQPSQMFLRGYSGQLKKVEGKADILVKFHGKEANLPIFLTGDNPPTLLGRNWMRELGIGLSNVECHFVLLEQKFLLNWGNRPPILQLSRMCFMRENQPYISQLHPTCCMRNSRREAWTIDVIESLNALKLGNSRGRILDHARAMLQSCLETACDETISQRNARDLRIFLEQRKLSWPGDPQRPDVHPLDVLLDLAINWQMPLWFNVGILTTSVTLLLADRRLLTTTDHFFAKFFREELLDHMSRSVVNAFANVIYSATPSAKDNAGTTLNDSAPCPTTAVRTRCELQAEYTYRLSLAVNHGEHVGMAAQRALLLVIINEALRAAVAVLIRRKNMASEQRHGSTDAAINKLQRVRLDVWPSDELLRKSRDELELMYSSFPEPNAASSYLEHLLATRRALRSLLGSPTYRDLTGIGARGGRSCDGFFGYDPFENAVSVWPGALREPLFYARATKAVNYGGVGAAFARQLTAAMDVDEVFFNAETSTWSVHHRDRANVTKGDLNAEQRALGIAHDAYVENVEFDKGGAGAQHVVSLEEFSAKQIFFISYCHSLCQLLPFRGHQRCTNAVKGFDYFEEAFHCKASKL